MAHELATIVEAPRLHKAEGANTRSFVEVNHQPPPTRESIAKTAATVACVYLALLATLNCAVLLLRQDLPSTADASAVRVIFAILSAAIFAAVAAMGMYFGARLLRRVRTQCIGLLPLWVVVVAGFYVLAPVPISLHLGFAELGPWILLGAAMIIASRAAFRDRLHAACHPSRFTTRVALVGSKAETRRLSAFLERPEQRLRYTVAGVFDDGITEDEDGGQGTVHKADSLPFIVGAMNVDMVIAAPPWSDPAAVNRLCARLSAVPANVHLLTEIATVSPVPPARSRRFAGRVMVELWTLPLATWRAAIKRAEDVVISLALLVILAPVMALTALLIKLDSPGPVLFRQTRYGFANRPIRVTKFRTMRHDRADASGAWATTRNDPRVTRLGALLRRASLDELPQLFDVLRGDMSLVGPRAHPVEMRVDGLYYADAVACYAARHLVKPGITGLAQINGCRGHVDTRRKAERRVELDLQYIETWSLALDLWILWRSVFVGFVHENAY